MQYKAYIGESLSSLLPVAVRVVHGWCRLSCVFVIYRLFFK